MQISWIKINEFHLCFARHLETAVLQMRVTHHFQWKPLNTGTAQSLLAFQIQTWEVRALRGFTLHYAWDVCDGICICFLHLEQQFIYFCLIATTERFVFFFLSPRIVFIFSKVIGRKLWLLRIFGFVV